MYLFSLKAKLALIILSLFISFDVDCKWISHSFEVMGTQSTIEFEVPSEKIAPKTLQLVIDEMHRIDALMSPFKPTSELSKINRLASTTPIHISKELYDLLVKSADFSKLTEGAFDISFSSVGYLYDYRNSVKPTQKQIENLKKNINYRSIRLNKKNQTVKFLQPLVKIDLGGIAKGYAVDQCIQILKDNGVVNAYVSAGGDSRIIGKKDNRLWYIGIKHPRDKKRLLVNLPLEEVSISTSGDYERFFEKDGVRYHHIIDPKTGDSARGLQSVTILAPSSTTADALSTSVFVLGLNKGLKLVNGLADTSAILVDSQGRLHYSDDIARLE
ncbi:MAG: thiamine biosynthesis protein ApbE [Kangiella sp.]|nr:MAG: thiamine biosynthesis protein ApbE [Kangiella sp.]